MCKPGEPCEGKMDLGEVIQDLLGEGKKFQNTATFRRGGYHSISRRIIELGMRIEVMARIHPDPALAAELKKIDDDFHALGERFGKLILESDDMKGIGQ